MSSLPVILVSAKSEAAASHIISELISHEPLEDEASKSDASTGVIWHIENKYYTADVRLLPAPDGKPPPHAAPDGHIIYLTEDECTMEAANAREGAGADAEVRVLAAECSELPPSLASWAAQNYLEPVPLKELPPSEDGSDDDEPRGIEAMRAALHAHDWPGLKRRGTRQRAESASEDDIERAEQWAAALGPLGEAARAVRDLPEVERRQAAEQLIAAFCHALGEDLDTL